MKKFIFPIIAVISALLSWGFVTQQKELIAKPTTRVASLLVELTGKRTIQYIETVDPEKVRIGKELVHKGWANVNGKKSILISKYYICTDCHNQVIEDPDLAHPTPEKRLEKAMKEKIRFLQGTTFYGQANRSTWYNQDYQIKYGEMVNKARDTLANAVQLCAKFCSAGRWLEKWEEDAIMHYLNTIDYKVSDLKFTDKELESLNGTKMSKEEKATLIQSKYMSFSPATFMETQAKKERGLGVHGDKKKGHAIYVQSCLVCHHQEHLSTMFKLEDSMQSRKYLASFVKKDHHFSIYDITRHGTKSDYAIRSYMPLYTKERLSDQQLEDLTAYIMAKK
jgi:mono/diheme cytochrome c family protein